MRFFLGLFCGMFALGGWPAAAAAGQGTAKMHESTARGTMHISQASHLLFDLPAGRWARDVNDSGKPNVGAYIRSSVINGRTCQVNLLIDALGQHRRPTLTLGKLPTKQERRGTQGPYEWVTALSTGKPGPAAAAPSATAFRRAPRSAKWNYAVITAGVGFVEPATAACHRSGRRIDLLPPVTSFRVASGPATR